MSKVITFDKGSKRRLDRIRWKLNELLSLALLAVVIFGLSVLVMLWEIRHKHPAHAPVTGPQIRKAEALDFKMTVRNKLAIQ